MPRPTLRPTLLRTLRSKPFRVAGLRPGAHIIRVEPLDDADVDSFFDLGSIEINFRPAFYSRVVAVPAGGSAPRVDVTVGPK